MVDVVAGGSVVVEDVEVVVVASVVTGATVVEGADVVDVSSAPLVQAAATPEMTNRTAVTLIRDMRREDKAPGRFAPSRPASLRSLSDDRQQKRSAAPR